MGRYTAGVDENGKPRALARPGEAILATHHTPAHVARGMEHQKTPNTIAQKSSTAKMHLDVPIYNAMTPMQQQLRGMGHAVGSAPDASAANPLDPTVPGKRLSPPAIHPSMAGGSRAVTLNAGDVMREAYEAAEPDHPQNLGRVK